MNSFRILVSNSSPNPYTIMKSTYFFHKIFTNKNKAKTFQLLSFLFCTDFHILHIRITNF